MTQRAHDLQSEALRALTVLSALQPQLTRPDWPGSLLLAVGLTPIGSALSLAANIAGAASLAIDPRPEACRAALHSGACDFSVNTLDEAMRILKNQVRQRRPVSVALEAPPTPAVAELLDRGVLPQLFTALEAIGSAEATASIPAALDSATLHRAIGAFAAGGALIVDFDGSLSAASCSIDASALFDSYTHAHALHLETIPFASAEELRAFDARLLALLPAAGPRHRWASAAPRFFHRDRPYRRTVLLTRDELQLLRHGH